MYHAKSENRIASFSDGCFLAHNSHHYRWFSLVFDAFIGMEYQNEFHHLTDQTQLHMFHRI